MTGTALVVAGAALLFVTASSTGATTYYVDPAGSDEAAGTRPDRAWKTLARASKATLGPGDQLLLKSGARFTGQLVVNAKGTERRPARVGKHGGKAYPVIAGEGIPNTTVEVRNPVHVVIQELEITNELADGKRRDGLAGITVTANSGGDLADITLRRLHVHHVSGGWDRHGGFGIYCPAAGDNPKTGSKRSRFVDLRIEDCYVHDVSFYGIAVSGWENRFRDERWFPSLGVRVRNNLIHDTGGDAIVLITTKNATMEHNEAYRGSQGQLNGGSTPSGGMWPHSSDGTIVRYNKVAGIRGLMDCEPYDIDINCRNTTIEHNISQDNSGGFLLLCSIVGEAGRTYGAVVRNNLSIGDGFESKRLITAVGLVSDVTIENNVVIGPAKPAINVLGGWESKEYPWCEKITLRRNLFVTDGEFTFDTGGMRDIVCDGNTFHGSFTKPPTGIDRLDAKPLPVALRPFDLSQCGLTKVSPWLAERDRAAGAYTR